MRNSGINGLQEFVFVWGVLIKNVFGLVNNLDDLALLFVQEETWLLNSKIAVFLNLLILLGDITVQFDQGWPLRCVILVRDPFENKIVQEKLIELVNLAQRETNFIFNKCV